MKEFVRLMKALSDPNRVRIVKLLQLKELCVCELRELLGLAQSTVSKHLKILEDSNLVESRRDGSWIIYRIQQSPPCVYGTAVLKNMPAWLNDDPELIRMKAQLPQIDRIRILAV